MIPSTSPRWTFWLQWALAGALGWTISAVILGALNLLGSTASQSWLLIIVKALLTGIPIGLLQSLVLRRWVNRPFRWVAAWTLGVIGGGIAVRMLAVLVFFFDSPVLYALFDHSAGPLLIGSAFGAGLGSVQALYLGRWVYRAGWWIPASMVAVGLSDLIRDLLFGSWWITEPLPVPYLAVIISGTLTEVFLGLVLLWMLRSTIGTVAVEPEDVAAEAMKI